MNALDTFTRACEIHQPSFGIVLGSGLAAAVEDLPSIVSIAFSDIHELCAPTIAGHRGELRLVKWHGVHVVLSLGRLHLYEGHTKQKVTAIIELLAALGIRNLILTNAAGSLKFENPPGSFMRIIGQIDLQQPMNFAVDVPYDDTLLHLLNTYFPTAGVYLAVLGPNYETPAEIRAFQALGAAAVGMSTVLEAKAAKRLGMHVAGISCLTNYGAGIVEGKLDHHDVQQQAQRVSTDFRTRLDAFFAHLPMQRE